VREVPVLALVLVALGVALIVGSLAAIRMGAAQPRIARSLAGPREVRVGDLAASRELPDRPVRVVGRIRCREPLHLGGDERLVAFHRDVEVRIGGRWRRVERIRESRSFELWDHDGSLTVDPAHAAEPLIAIPKVWRGDPMELEEPHRSAVARLAERTGQATNARATTRTINVTDRLAVIARPVLASDGQVRLEPPAGGFLISALAVDDAMRLLAGRHRRLAAAGVIGTILGAALIAAALLLGLGSLLVGR
jgi:hypothetical protein